MMDKIFWYDIESGGLNFLENPILSLSGIIEIDGKIIDQINLKMKPFQGDKIVQEALDINGFSIEQIKTFDDPKIAFNKLINFLSKYINRYDKKDKLTLAGYNIIKFDIPFLEQLFKKCNDKYFGSWVNGEPIDVYQIVIMMKRMKFLELEGAKLEIVADNLDISLKAHDAKEDILETREIYYKLMDKIKVKK